MIREVLEVEKTQRKANGLPSFLQSQNVQLRVVQAQLSTMASSRRRSLSPRCAGSAKPASEADSSSPRCSDDISFTDDLGEELGQLQMSARRSSAAFERGNRMAVPHAKGSSAAVRSASRCRPVTSPSAAGNPGSCFQCSLQLKEPLWARSPSRQEVFACRPLATK